MSGSHKGSKGLYNCILVSLPKEIKDKEIQQMSSINSNREVKEMKAHDAAISLTKEWADDSTFVLNENDIRNLHEIVLVKDYFKIKLAISCMYII
mgnify:CR=1 FL=1